MRLLLLALTIMACASVPLHPAEVPSDMSVRYDPAMSWQQLSWVQDALRQWCEATDSEQACWSLRAAADSRRPRWSGSRIKADPSPMTIWVAGELDPMFLGMVAARGERINAVTDCRAVVILFEPQLTTRHDWIRTTIHEFGHVIGLDHEHGESMSPAGRGCVSADTLAAACERIDCGPEAAPTCE